MTEIEAKIIKVYKNWSVEQTARILKKDVAKIRQVLKKHDVKIRRPGEYWRSKKQ